MFLSHVLGWQAVALSRGSQKMLGVGVLGANFKQNAFSEEEKREVLESLEKWVDSYGRHPAAMHDYTHYKVAIVHGGNDSLECAMMFGSLIKQRKNPVNEVDSKEYKRCWEILRGEYKEKRGQLNLPEIFH